MHCKWYSCLQLVTVEGSVSQKGSKQMLQASSQASCMPPSTKAAADVKWVPANMEVFSSSINDNVEDRLIDSEG